MSGVGYGPSVVFVSEMGGAPPPVISCFLSWEDHQLCLSPMLVGYHLCFCQRDGWTVGCDCVLVEQVGHKLVCIRGGCVGHHLCLYSG